MKYDENDDYYYGDDIGVVFFILYTCRQAGRQA